MKWCKIEVFRSLPHFWLGGSRMHSHMMWSLWNKCHNIEHVFINGLVWGCLTTTYVLQDILPGLLINGDALSIPTKLNALINLYIIIIWHFGNPKYDQFHKVKLAPKGRKSTDHNQILINSEGGHGTSACTIWGHSLHGFNMKCSETSNLTSFTDSYWHQKKENQRSESSNLTSFTKSYWHQKKENQ